MRVEEVAKGEDGQKILRIVSKLLMGNHTPESLLSSGLAIPNEVVYEAETILLIKRNRGASQERQKRLLKSIGFSPYVDSSRGVYVFFGSSYAPECDAYVYWDQVEKDNKFDFDEEKPKWKEEGF